jgi:hypothetical protein
VAQTDTEGAVGLSVGASIQAGGQPPAAGLLPCCGPARVLASAPPFANTRAQVAHCRLPQNDRDRSRGWLGERRPTQQVWIPVSSPRGHIRHSLRLPAILKYNVNEHFHIPSTGSCNIVSARLAGRSTSRQWDLRCLPTKKSLRRARVLQHPDGGRDHEPDEQHSVASSHHAAGKEDCQSKRSRLCTAQHGSSRFSSVGRAHHS